MGNLKADDIEQFQAQIAQFQSKAIQLDPVASTDPEIGKIFKTFENILADCNRKLAIINEFTAQQNDVLSSQDKMKTSTLSANQAMLTAEQIVASFITTKIPDGVKASVSQEELAKAYKAMTAEHKKFSSQKIPTLDGSYDHVIEISEKLGALQDSIKAAQTKLNKAGQINGLLQSGMKFLDSISTSIQKSIGELNDDNNALKKYSGSLTADVDSLKRQIKTILEPIIGITVQAKNDAKKGAGAPVPLSSSHGANQLASLQKALGANAGAVHPAPKAQATKPK
jgi:hypothetical protein